VLRTLERSGRIERIGTRYRRAREDGLVEGVFRGTRGHGQVREDTGAVWRVKGDVPARPGDRVVLQPDADPSQRGGQVLGVLGGERRTRVGVARVRKGAAFATPYRDDDDWRVSLPRRSLGGARDGDVVVLEPARGASFAPGISAPGKVIEVLGPPGTPEADVRAVVWHRRLPVHFPDAVLRAAETVSAEPEPEEIARRIDLRERAFVTIDPETARDHDDAVCVAETPGGGAQLWVAIADVSHFVAEGSPLDAEALRRGVSVYFPDRAIPMLPERLSGDACSLVPDADRLAMVVELEVDAKGMVTRRSFYPAVIRSRARLSYPVAARAMESRGGASAGMPASIARDLRLLARIARRLLRRRSAHSIDFEIPSPEIQLDSQGRPTDIVRAPRTIAHRAIEECMLAANRAVAEVLEESGLASIYRIHEPPAPQDAEALQELLVRLGLLDQKRSDSLTSAVLARALERASGKPEEPLVNRVALRSMRQARYDAINRGHYALAFEHYTHFTSPIRRYADLVVHRVLKVLLAEPGVGEFGPSPDSMRAVAGRVSWRERVAVQAERDMASLAQCEFMSSRVGQEFDGVVTGVARHGLYITLDEHFVEGLVHVSTLPGHYVLDERNFALVASGSAPRYRLGDRMRVRLDAVDRIAAHVDFSIVAAS
jgi:ribonuclease R